MLYLGDLYQDWLAVRTSWKRNPHFSNLMPMLRAFRIIGMAEAVSFLLLLGIAMPLKYMADMPMAVRYVGLAHGILFILYLGVALGAAVANKWPISRLFLAGVASLLPFGPFAFDKWILREESR